MLSSHKTLAAYAVALLLTGTFASPAQADSPPQSDQKLPAGGTASTGAGASSGGGISAEATTVTVVTEGETTTQQPFHRAVTASVPRRCWYGPGSTGKDYYEFWKDGGDAHDSPTLDAYGAAGGVHPGFEQYATDTEGRWYEPVCSAIVPTEELIAYFQSHQAVFVHPGDPAPAVDEAVDPQVLAQVAATHMDIPTGTIRWNPTLSGSGATLVNTDTFVWIEDATTAVQVTASVRGLAATVEAHLTSMSLAAPNADTTTCPYTDGTTTGTCVIVFTRSTAGMLVKAGQTQPTATLTATATWEATWTSTLDPTPRALDTQTLTTTAEVPVAEIQSLVTD